MAFLVGTGVTRLGKRPGRTATQLMQEGLELALSDAKITLRQIRACITVPSLSEPRFMQSHYLCTVNGILPSRERVQVRTLDTGGAGPVSGLLEAHRLIQDGVDVCVVVGGDAVSSMSTQKFLRRADAGFADGSLPSPVIPHGYDRVAQWHSQAYGMTREQLAMVPVLMAHQGARHPNAVSYGRPPITLDQVLESATIAPWTNLYECARRCDGGGAIVLASADFLERAGLPAKVRVVGGGEASGPLFPPPVVDEDMFTCEKASRVAYRSAGLTVDDIDFFGLYDCYSICFLRAIEAVGLAKKGEGGAFVEKHYEHLMKHGEIDHAAFPINTHGGLLSFGAPWELPALFNITEAYDQLLGRAGSRQLPGQVKRALVYGNGGIFSHAAVAILERVQ